MSNSRLFLGVDGGGTKTEFVCIGGDGAVAARATAGTSYHLQVGLSGAIEVLGVGIDTICRSLAITPAAFAFVFFGLPAYGEDSVVDPRLAKACGRLLGHDRWACGNDMICGWAGSLACEDGINLVAGTGSIGYGERRGVTARAGGWGEVFGDEGSAYWLGVQGLNAFTRMSDGRLPRGPLHARIVEALGLGADIDLCARVMGEPGMTRDQIAALSTLVSAAARDGDTAALHILDAAADELAAIAKALRATLGFAAEEASQLSWSGGVLTCEPLVRNRLRAHLGEPEFQLVEPRHDPGYGAALYAAHLARRLNVADQS